MDTLLLIQQIISLIPMATRVVMEVNGAIREFDTTAITPDDLTKALVESKTWPALTFKADDHD